MSYISSGFYYIFRNAFTIAGNYSGVNDSYV